MDYTYPSVFLAYLFFGLSAGLAGYFLVRSLRDGYWGKHGEDIKFRMLEDDEGRPHE
jgi:H+/Cl- antiporter ClcA